MATLSFTDAGQVPLSQIGGTVPPHKTTETMT